MTHDESHKSHSCYQELNQLQPPRWNTGYFWTNLIVTVATIYDLV